MPFEVIAPGARRDQIAKAPIPAIPQRYDVIQRRIPPALGFPQLELAVAVKAFVLLELAELFFDLALIYWRPTVIAHCAT